MASITREGNGRRTIQFVSADKKRRSIRLGRVSQRAAEAVKVRVEHLVAASITRHAVDDETARWVAGLDDVLHDKLAAVGLVSKRVGVTLAAFIDGYIDSRTDAKPATITTYRRAKNKVLGYFRQDTRLRDITPGDADDFARWLRDPRGGRLSKATAQKTLSIAKQMFRAAFRKKIVVENPFADLSGTVPANRERDYFVSREEAQKVLESCPDAEWRLLFALSRYGGLRCPSETLGLRWVDIDWSRNRMTVHSPKTAHHEGGARRLVPIFTELRPYLLDVFDQADDGAEYIIVRYRDSAANLRTQLTRIIKRAGLTPWPKLWQNMRATRETELAEIFPAHVVSAWIGNSVAVAARHYLQVTDEHFERAASEAVQNPVQHSAARSRTESQGVFAADRKLVNCDEMRDNAKKCEIGQKDPVGPAGLEPATSGL